MGLILVRNSITIQMMIQRKRITIYTGLTTDHWDAGKQRVPSKSPFAWEINDKLVKVEEFLKRYKIEIKLNERTLDKAYLENEILAITNPEKPTELKKQISYLWQYVEVFITRKKELLSAGYLKNWPSLAEHIKAFDPSATFLSITPDWQESFAKWLYGKDLTQNTVSNKITYIQTMARDARKLGYQLPLDFEDYAIKRVTQPVFYLDWDTQVKEMERIPLIPQLDVIRDRFIFRCYTGIREGEMESLKPLNFYQKDGFDWLRYWDIKGKKWKTIGLNEKAVEIANKYNQQFPPVSQQEENVLIKQVGLLANIDYPVEKIRHFSSKIERSEVRAYQMISTHTARRTFARRWYDQGGDLLLLSRYLGHSDLGVTKIYIGLEDQEASREMFRIMG